VAGPRPSLALIFAVGENGALGHDGGLPWSWPEDRAYFERTTRGHAVIMGRRTFDETGEPLVDRTNVVVSSTMEPRPGLRIVRSLDEAITLARRADPMPFVIGGVRLFEEALPHATRVHVTTLPLAPAADVYFHLDRTGFEVLETWRDAGGARYEVLARR
jgi:dihydrofolate reductase